MKSASKIMYTIGKVMNIISIVFLSMFLILAVFSTIFYQDIYNNMGVKFPSNWTANSFKATSIAMIVVFSIALVVSIVILVLAIRSSKALENDDANVTPHIIMVVIGAFGEIFYLLGGIFGLVEASEKARKQVPPSNN